jgi:hypothetical protein
VEIILTARKSYIHWRYEAGKNTKEKKELVWEKAHLYAATQAEVHVSAGAKAMSSPQNTVGHTCSPLPDTTP